MGDPEDGRAPSDRDERVRTRPRLRSRASAAAAAAVVAVATVTVGRCSSGTTSGADDAAVEPALATVISQAVEDALAERGLSAAEIYAIVRPSLVLVEVGGADPTSEEVDEGAGADDPAGRTSGFGSGVVVNADGSVLTALHVIDGAESITVMFADGTRTSAVVASREPARDMAVLSPDALPSVVTPTVLGSSARVAVGDVAVAVGHPLALVGSVTAGVISGLDRSVPVGDTGQQLDGLIQFDAAVNPGSSGGPLINARGETIGIVTGLANPSDQAFFIGVGFAVPISAALDGGGGGSPAR